MKISTARGLDILVDDEDYDYLSQFSWYANAHQNGRFYAYARVAKGIRMSMHRLLMNPPQGMVVHHINNDGLDNRRCNLEVATNSKNLKAVREGTVVGVHLHKQTGKWRVQICTNRKRTSLGMYKTREEAEAVAVRGYRLDKYRPKSKYA